MFTTPLLLLKEERELMDDYISKSLVPILTLQYSFPLNATALISIQGVYNAYKSHLT